MPESRPQPVTDPDYPDLLGIEGGWSFPCKVLEITATTAPTTRAEGIGDLNATYEQTQRYIIRVRPKPVEATYMTGVSDAEIERAEQAVRESAAEIMAELWPSRHFQGGREPTGWVSTICVGGEYTPEHQHVLDAYREAHGIPTAGMPAIPTAAEVNAAVTWWRGRRGHVGALLTSADPEPPAGTVVETESGERWWRDGGPGPCEWFPLSQLTNPDRHDPESWTKVAGNYGPVKVVSMLNG